MAPVPDDAPREFEQWDDSDDFDDDRCPGCIKWLRSLATIPSAFKAEWSCRDCGAVTFEKPDERVHLLNYFRSICFCATGSLVLICIVACIAYMFSRLK